MSDFGKSESKEHLAQFGDEENVKYTSDEGVQITRKQTTIEKEVLKRKAAAHEYLADIPEMEETKEIAEYDVNPYIPLTLKDAMFCGHLVTDLDSIAGAIGAAELYGGIPARASEVNSETAFALHYWGVEKPVPIEELLESHPEAGVCLVDHQQTSQLNKSIPIERIVGVIDHHALQNSTIVTDMPIYIDIRPWGSMSTIICHSFMMYRRRPKKQTAGMLLCAILSDTLNLQGPTTTEWDRLMVAILADIAGVVDVQLLASQQFKAKSSELGGLSAQQLINGDQKVFTFKTDLFEGSLGFAVIETTDDGIIMSRTEELLIALNRCKEEKGLSLLFLGVVNIVDLGTQLLVMGPDEISLAKESFPDCTHIEDNVLDLKSRVSRKKDFIPAMTRTIKSGWAQAPQGSIKASKSDIWNIHGELDSHTHDVSQPPVSPLASKVRDTSNILSA